MRTISRAGLLSSRLAQAATGGRGGAEMTELSPTLLASAMAAVLADNGPQTALALAVPVVAWLGRRWRGSELSVAAALLALALSYLLLWRMRQADSTGIGENLFTVAIAYLLPAGLLARPAARRPAGEPFPFRYLLGLSAALLALFWASLELRRVFHGAVSSGPVGEAERLAYLLLWSVPAAAPAGWLWRRCAVGAGRKRRPAQLSS